MKSIQLSSFFQWQNQLWPFFSCHIFDLRFFSLFLSILSSSRLIKFPSFNLISTSSHSGIVPTLKGRFLEYGLKGSTHPLIVLTYACFHPVYFHSFPFASSQPRNIWGEKKKRDWKGENVYVARSGENKESGLKTRSEGRKEHLLPLRLRGLGENEWVKVIVHT